MTTASPLSAHRVPLVGPRSQSPAQQLPPGVKTINGVLNLGKIGEVRLDLIPSLEECKPGLRPTEYNVIVAPAKVSETMGSLGVIRRSDQDIEAEEMSRQVGRIILASPLAFNYDNAWPEGTKPKVGDIVWFARYAGALIESAFDGKMYRMVKDKDIAAIIDPPVPQKVFELD